MFERPITFRHGDGSTSAGRIDLYRRGCFVLESKKLRGLAPGKGFDDALLRARSQAEAYARALPAGEGRPPFVVVVDVGQRIELYAEFSRSGGTYTPFPDPRSHRIALADLARPEIRDRLRRVFADPLSLDPSRESARVTRQIAARLAELAKSLEQAGHAPEAVAQFLMRCLFTMFAEDVRLLPADSFRNLLLAHAERPDTAMRMLGQLWRDMDTGGFSAVLANDVLRFNGKLFKSPDTLPLDRAQLGLLAEAARADWKHVEPAIFGTLLERALSTADRHKLGAHYTPRAYVERLVLPTVIEPLRAEWHDVYAAALVKNQELQEIEGELSALHPRAKERKNLDDRRRETQRAVWDIVRSFHHRLCTVRVLDPACGSGNFLYVTLEHLKRLEGEVLNALDELGYRQAGLALGGERADALAGETVDPHNLLGIELNPRAAAIAEVVLWIGYLQWHFRTRGDVSPPVPVIRDFRNIENRDAVLAYDSVEYVTDASGRPVTRWDGRTMKKSPVTGEDIPDDSARVPLERYVNPRKAEWPQADFIVGNPPFIGNKRMRLALGDGYVEALRSAWKDVPDSADFVMFWWDRAAELTRQGKLERFGLITTNSISQTFNRRVLEHHMRDPKQPLSIVFAIPDHPWVDSTDGAAVRIAMTVATAGANAGQLWRVTGESASLDGEYSISFARRYAKINADISVGADAASSMPLLSNTRLCGQGIKVVGEGFFVEPDRLRDCINPATGLPVARKYCSPKVVTHGKPESTIIDFHGLGEAEARQACADAYQQLLSSVKPLRDQNARASIREMWWKFGWDRPVFRAAVAQTARYLVTLETSKHRYFSFVHGASLCDGSLFWIALDMAEWLGILSSQLHLIWALANGGTLEDRPRYNNTTCFATFPFPDVSEEQRAKIRALGEALDGHRKRQQAAHSELTLTGMYNVLEKLRSGDVLSAKERVIHEQGLVSVLRQIHDDLDAAVLDAYGWSDLLPLLRIAHGNDAPAEGQSRDEAKRAFHEAILERLVLLNAERAAEEARGLVRWLRPEFQNPGAQPRPEQVEIDTGDGTDATGEEGTDADSSGQGAGKARHWPKDAVEQVRAVAEVLSASPHPLSLDAIAARFSGRGPWKKRLPQLLDMLVALGRARRDGDAYGAASN
jgi:hypothetical protein